MAAALMASPPKAVSLGLAAGQTQSLGWGASAAGELEELGILLYPSMHVWMERRCVRNDYVKPDRRRRACVMVAAVPCLGGAVAGLQDQAYRQPDSPRRLGGAHLPATLHAGPPWSGRQRDAASPEQAGTVRAHGAGHGTVVSWNEGRHLPTLGPHGAPVCNMWK